MTEHNYLNCFYVLIIKSIMISILGINIIITQSVNSITLNKHHLIFKIIMRLMSVTKSAGTPVLIFWTF